MQPRYDACEPSKPKRHLQGRELARWRLRVTNLQSALSAFSSHRCSRDCCRPPGAWHQLHAGSSRRQDAGSLRESGKQPLRSCRTDAATEKLYVHYILPNGAKKTVSARLGDNIMDLAICNNIDIEGCANRSQGFLRLSLEHRCLRRRSRLLDVPCCCPPRVLQEVAQGRRRGAGHA